MSLHDVDKGSDRRLNPKPNQNDQLNHRMAKGTTSANDVTLATNLTASDPTKYGFARYVKTGNSTITSDGSTLATLQIPHGLGYTPKVEAYLNNATNDEIPGVISIPLPTWTGMFIRTAAPNEVQFLTWLYVAGADDTNIYFQLANSTGVAVSYVVTYYLYQQVAEV